VKDRKIVESPCVDVKKLAEANARDRYLDEDEDELLLSKCTGQRAHLRNLIVFTLNTGGRRGEVLGLLKEDVVTPLPHGSRNPARAQMRFKGFWVTQTFG